MGVFGRKRKRGIVYYASFAWRGRRIQELAGTDKRRAEQLERLRKAQVKAGTYRPETGTAAMTVAVYSEHWGEARRNRSASDDRQRLRDHVVPELGTVRLDALEPRHTKQLADMLVSKKLAAKTVWNVMGAYRTMLRDARLEGLIASDPYVLPRKYLPRVRATEPEAYRLEEVAALLALPTRPDLAMLCALQLYGGLRQGEACGVRWGDVREAAPLACLSLERAYDDEPLKTDQRRKVPIHPELARRLKEWRSVGFPLVMRREPREWDPIVPRRGGKHHTKQSSYKALMRACEAAWIRFDGTHAARHTFITWARRCGARKEIIERVTHNARGDIVDQYTHWDWVPLCEAVGVLSYARDGHHALHRPGDTPEDSGPDGGADGPPESNGSARVPDSIPGSIPGASTDDPAKNKGPQKRRHVRRHAPGVAKARDVELAEARFEVALLDAGDLAAGGSR
jgi:integrase